MVVDYRDKVLAFVRSKGPILPVQIGKEVGTNILMASAMLSEMTSKGTLKVSSLKVGGSPLYFIPGQEGMLLNFIQHLNEKDRRVLELLKQHKVLRDQDQDALTRVSLRGLKDFAFALNVTHDGFSEVFWKWHDIPDAEASENIKTMLNAHIPAPQPAPVPAAPRFVAAEAVAVAAPAPRPPAVKPLPAQGKPSPAAIKPRKPRVTAPVEPAVTMPAPVATSPLLAAPPVAARSSSLFVHSAPAAVTQTVLEDPALSDPFYKQIQGFCGRANIKILEHLMLKKKQDYDLVLEVPSPVGSLVYYAKARNKFKLNDADLSAAFVQGQLRKLPTILLAPGELSKKAEELLVRDLRGVVFARLA
jgi:hypothetical protein